MIAILCTVKQHKTELKKVHLDVNSCCRSVNNLVHTVNTSARLFDQITFFSIIVNIQTIFTGEF